ncbi:MAG: Rieske 2Fe-2S domain-containing protein [Caldilineales bacterium]|nr:Rieske 2Fe-2S domain-containing protein [Caldilineales bacterium]
MNAPVTNQDTFKRGAADAGQYFRYMAAFIGFTDEDAATIRETRFIIEKHIPNIVADFYTQVLRFPGTRKHFTKKDGSIDHDYLEMRMQHQTHFWRRAASGEYDDDFARYIDYVGRAHTSEGADPNIYISQRYVIGMVGFVQHAVTRSLMDELHTLDPDLEMRGVAAWNRLMMVILELLARNYSPATDRESFATIAEIDPTAVHMLAVDAYERSLGIARSIECKIVFVADAAEIPEGKRKIVKAEGLSIGVFRHKGQWYALQNSCLHRGGPVCEGTLEGNTLTCPWHGYQYDVTTGKLLLDPSAALPMYVVDERPEGIYLAIPIYVRDEIDVEIMPLAEPAEADEPKRELHRNEFWVKDVNPGETTLVYISGDPVAVYNVDGEFFATQDECTHADGPLSEGHLDGPMIVCPWHNSCFDVTDGSVLCGPARQPLRTYAVVIDGDIGRVENGEAG